MHILYASFASFNSSREPSLHSFYYYVFIVSIYSDLQLWMFSATGKKKKKLDAWKQRGNEAEKSTAQWVENNSSLQLTSFKHTIVF